MALTKDAIITGLSAPQAYYNILSATSTKNPNKPESEGYLVQLVVNEYTDSTKEFHSSQRQFQYDDVLEADFNYPKYYELLKTEEYFTSAIDA